MDNYGGKLLTVDSVDKLFCNNRIKHCGKVSENQYLKAIFYFIHLINIGGKVSFPQVDIVQIFICVLK